MNDRMHQIIRTLSGFSYCPQPEKQRVRIEVCYEDEILTKAHVFMFQREFMHIDYGLGAGALYPPSAGSWAMIEKPVVYSGATLTYLVEIASVAPEYWLPVICFLSSGFVSMSNMYVASKSVTIRGECFSDSELYDKDRLMGLYTEPMIVPVLRLPITWMRSLIMFFGPRKMTFALKLIRLQEIMNSGGVFWIPVVRSKLYRHHC